MSPCRNSALLILLLNVVAVEELMLLTQMHLFDVMFELL